MQELLKAVVYGIIEGITEWLPISSTGHMILAEQLIQFSFSDAFMEMFRVVIQLGAILAVVVLFWHRLWPFGRDERGRVVSKTHIWRLWVRILIASVPAGCCILIDDWIDAHFYNYLTVACMLILYGVLFIVVENRGIRPQVTRISQITWRDALIIGLWQALAVIPGTSRSGATIVGGLLLGLSRACVAEFTFYLAIPAMAGASGYKMLKFLKAGNAFTGAEVGALAVGCTVAFLVSLLAIRFLMNYVKKHDFRVFGIYRIALGAVVLAAAAATFFA
jgi:undecaprenyl-diphosphatase